MHHYIKNNVDDEFLIKKTSSHLVVIHNHLLGLTAKTILFNNLKTYDNLKYISLESQHIRSLCENIFLTRYIL